MSTPVATEPIPSDVPAEELARYAEQLRQDVLSLERRVVAEIAARTALEQRLADLEES